MADGEVRIDTKLDTSGIDKGVKDLKSKIDNAGKTIDAGFKKSDGLAKSFKGLNAGAVTAAGGAAAAAIAIKKTVDALNQCAAVYKVQEKAEKALEVAAKNNPYLNSESVYNLKNFASELQNFSEVGDEVSINVMSQLAAAGRNEEEIMKIMKAAADYAAATGTDIASAAQTLNMTYNGMTGTLGRQIGEIKNLTKAELESGAAIDIIAQKYKGFAADTADVGVQLSNSWGDFKENLGRGWSKVTDPIKGFFKDVLNNINAAVAAANDTKDKAAVKEAGTTTRQDLAQGIVDDEKKQIEGLNEQKKIYEDYVKQYEELTQRLNAAKTSRERRGINTQISKLETQAMNETGQAIEDMGAIIDNVNKSIEEHVAEQEKWQKIVDENTAKLKAETEAANKRAEAEKKAADQKKRDEAATELIKANTKALNEQIAAIKIKADVEEKEIDAGEMYNAYLESYIDLISKSNGLITEENTAAKTRLAILKQWAEKAQAAATAEERLSAAQQLQQEAENLTAELKKNSLDNYFSNYEEKNKQIAKMEKALNKDLVDDAQQKADAQAAIDEAYVQNKKDLFHNLTNEIKGYTDETVEIMNQAAELMTQAVQLQSEKELAELENKYEKGEVSETEYYEKQKEIKRKAAQEEYKIQMFQWHASVLTATANIAEGVSKAIAQGGTAGLISGALVGAAGAVQIASIIASKPIPPQFADGGIIGGANGATMGGDNTYIHARTGEMVLNAHQQRSLWDMINGQDSRQQAGLNLTVNNTQANRVDADVREQDGEVFIDILDKHINKGFTDGTYDAGLAAMNTRQEGVRIL